MRNRPVSYLSFRAVPAPPGAEQYGYFNYKIHENVMHGDQEASLALLSRAGNGRSTRRPSCVG
jgi:hypothetical protein